MNNIITERTNGVVWHKRREANSSDTFSWNSTAMLQSRLIMIEENKRNCEPVGNL